MPKTRLKRNSSSFNIRTRTETIILWIFFVIYVLYAITLFFPMIWTGYNSLKSMKDYNADLFNFPGLYSTCPGCPGESDFYTCADYAGMCRTEISAFFAEQKAAGSSDIGAFFSTVGQVISNMFGKAIKWDNYLKVFDEETMSVSIPFAIFNTVWRTLGSCLLGIFFTACTSYVVCKYSDRFKWLNHIYTFVVTIMIVPVLGSTAAAYEINHNILGIANNPLLWWVTWTSGIGFGFLMQYSAWKSLSWNYAEAAFIDGASNFQVFFRIMMPMVRPILTALFVVNFISGWGEYMTTIMYMDEWPSLGYMVYSLQEQSKRFGMPMYYAVIMISMVPTVGIFIAFQETIMQNMTTGGLKG